MASNWSGFVKNFFHFKEQQKNKEGRKSVFRGLLSNTNIGKPPPLKFLPSYRLESKKPVNREMCEKVIKNVVSAATAHFSYSSKEGQKMAKNISEEIKTRIKLDEYDRYKLVCIVTIGEKYYQGYNSVFHCLWDEEKDGYVSYTHDTPDFFLVATLYFLYYD